MHTVVIKSIDRERIQAAVHEYAAQLRLEHPEIQRILWFGSWTTGLPTPGSDVDICLILSHSDTRPRDRISKYLPLGFPVGIDLFAYTQDEFDRLQRSSPGMAQAILSGKEV